VVKELAIIRGVENAREVKAYSAAIVKALGMIDARIVQRALGERKTYAEVAALADRAGARGTNYYAHRFRDALEELAKQWSARAGPVSPRLSTFELAINVKKIAFVPPRCPVCPT
jgi:hypothetical protein